MLERTKEQIRAGTCLLEVVCARAIIVGAERGPREERPERDTDRGGASAVTRRSWWCGSGGGATRLRQKTEPTTNQNEKNERPGRRRIRTKERTSERTNERTNEFARLSTQAPPRLTPLVALLCSLSLSFVLRRVSSVVGICWLAWSWAGSRALARAPSRRRHQVTNLTCFATVAFLRLGCLGVVGVLAKSGQFEKKGRFIGEVGVGCRCCGCRIGRRGEVGRIGASRSLTHLSRTPPATCSSQKYSARQRGKERAEIRFAGAPQAFSSPHWPTEQRRSCMIPTMNYVRGADCGGARFVVALVVVNSSPS